MQFERSAPREPDDARTRCGFIAAALEFRLGAAIGRSMAIGVATQFETMLRQKDVIGEWTADAGGRESWSGPGRWGTSPAGFSDSRLRR
jgi:hypothetical protein